MINWASPGLHEPEGKTISALIQHGVPSTWWRIQKVIGDHE